MQTKIKITTSNLTEYAGRRVTLNCFVGVVLHDVQGVLVIGYGFCAYAVELADGSKIGFSFGEAVLNEDGSLRVNIS